jgi:Tfp pilus assembly protein PilE
MIGLWLAFAILAILVHFGITAWRNMTGKERWNLTKSVMYSIIVALLAVVAMTVIVILF